MTWDVMLIAQNDPVPATGNSLVLIAASVAWAAIWVQFIVLPFFNKGESLHKDYFASGRIAAAMAEIEAGQLIPTLSKMFLRVMEARPDKRKRLESEIEALLQSVEFIPDLKVAQASIAKIDDINDCYKRLRLSSTRLWKVGFVHALLTPLTVCNFTFLRNWQVTLVILATFWLVTFAASTYGAFRIHRQLDRFTASLENKECS